MDLFGPIFVKSLNKKSYFLVVIDDYSMFTWVFFLATKDETSPILKTFITGLDNQLSIKVKVIRIDNGTEFKNNDLNQFCGMKGIKREFSIPRTPQQNGITERKNRTLIEATRTMLADLLGDIFNTITSYRFGFRSKERRRDEIFLERESQAPDYLGFRPIHVTGLIFIMNELPCSMDELPCSTQYLEANNLPRSEFIVTLIRKFIEIAVVVKLLSLSLSTL
nr:putative ribonuclease H-like domain-containing protein [Tanacetum cinerariifolium]